MHRVLVCSRIMPVGLWCDDIPGSAVHSAQQRLEGVLAYFVGVVVLVGDLAVNAVKDLVATMEQLLSA